MNTANTHSGITSRDKQYYPYGDCRKSTGTLGTDRLFTGQLLDTTGLYYYGARYYDPTIGRFISADTLVQNPAHTQSFNRYSYCFNNPLKYIDPTGQEVYIGNTDVSEFEDISNEVNQYKDDREIPLDLLAQFIKELNGMGDEGPERFSEWEDLKAEEPEYTQHMEESVIKFNVDSIDLSSKTINFQVNMPLMTFDKPVQIRFVNGSPMSLVMKYLLDNAAGLAINPIRFRTDKPMSTETFTWIVAHEVYHHWEQSIVGSSYWFERYIREMQGTHDTWPSEIRANKYANRYYPYKPN